MASTLEFVEYVCGRLDGCGEIRYRKMFGEYMIYINDKPIILACDNLIYVKKHPALAEVMAGAEIGCPYPGAKEHYLLDIDNSRLTRTVVAILEPLTPQPASRKRKKKVLFVCLGNICRSPAAQGVFQHIVDSAGMTDRFVVDSAGTYRGHEGCLPDARMRMHAARRGYDLTHRARPVTMRDFSAFDIILAMDDANFDDLRALAPDVSSERKVRRMVEFCRSHMNDSVPDPYYSGADGFELVLDLLEDACRGLFDYLVVSDRGR